MKNYVDQIKDLIKNYYLDKFNGINFVPGVTPIPVSGKKIDYEEMSMVTEAVLDGWFTTGRFNEMFERELSNFIGIKKAITVNSGSSANLVAFSTLTSSKLGSKAIKPGDEVIAVAAGFPTTVNPIIQNRAVPVFVDISLDHYNIDVSKIEKAITPKTKAIMLAHTLGIPFELDKIKELCVKHNLWLIEDCCDALGSTYNNQHVGTFGDIATLSFYPAHHITMGEGGAVFSNNIELLTIAESFRDWGRDCYCKTGQDNTCGKRFCWKLGDLPEGYDHKYIYSHMGFNMKITDMQAACGLAQLKKLNDFISQRKKNFDYLTMKLDKCSKYLLLPRKPKNSDPSWFGFPISIKNDAGFKRLDLLNYLEQNKIGTRLIFAGNLVKQPYMKNVNFKISENLNNTDFVMHNTFWIGVHPSLSKEMLDYIAEKIETFLGINF